jgi:hypothetical protein
MAVIVILASEKKQATLFIGCMSWKARHVHGNGGVGFRSKDPTYLR